MTYKAKFVSEKWHYTETIPAENDFDAVKKAKSRLAILKDEKMLEHNSVLWEIYKNGKKIWHFIKGYEK